MTLRAPVGRDFRVLPLSPSRSKRILAPSVCRRRNLDDLESKLAGLQNQDHTISIKASRVLPISITAAET